MATIAITKKNYFKKVKLFSYAGEWVAFLNEKIIAHNKNLNDLIKEIDSIGIRKKASVFLVPRKDEGPYVLFIL